MVPFSVSFGYDNVCVLRVGVISFIITYLHYFKSASRLIFVVVAALGSDLPLYVTRRASAELFPINAVV